MHEYRQWILSGGQVLHKDWLVKNKLSYGTEVATGIQWKYKIRHIPSTRKLVSINASSGTRVQMNYSSLSPPLARRKAVSQQQGAHKYAYTYIIIIIQIPNSNINVSEQP